MVSEAIRLLDASSRTPRPTSSYPGRGCPSTLGLWRSLRTLGFDALNTKARCRGVHHLPSRFIGIGILCVLPRLARGRTLEGRPPRRPSFECRQTLRRVLRASRYCPRWRWVDEERRLLDTSCSDIEAVTATPCVRLAFNRKFACSETVCSRSFLGSVLHVDRVHSAAMKSMRLLMALSPGNGPLEQLFANARARS